MTDPNDIHYAKLLEAHRILEGVANDFPDTDIGDFAYSLGSVMTHLTNMFVSANLVTEPTLDLARRGKI